MIEQNQAAVYPLKFVNSLSRQRQNYIIVFEDIEKLENSHWIKNLMKIDTEDMKLIISNVFQIISKATFLHFLDSWIKPLFILMTSSHTAGSILISFVRLSLGIIFS